MGYDFYEFLALDRPLTSDEQAELDELSSRSSPTDRRIAFEYNYSTLSANVTDLVAEYFDVGLHVSKYGRRRLLFRVPSNHPVVDILPTFLVPESLACHEQSERIVFVADVTDRDL
ncbi:MAG: hypothetical protein ABEK29_02625, partial [Bradymonadaceae bacterium]